MYKSIFSLPQTLILTFTKISFDIHKILSILTMSSDNDNIITDSEEVENEKSGFSSSADTSNFFNYFKTASLKISSSAPAGKSSAESNKRRLQQNIHFCVVCYKTVSRGLHWSDMPKIITRMIGRTITRNEFFLNGIKKQSQQRERKKQGKQKEVS